MIRRALIALASALTLATAAPLQAAEATPMTDNPVVEARLIAISEELRCLVCQNESLAASRAELADDLRREVRKLIHDGKTDAEIRDYLVARYGDFVLYRPPVKPTTWLLWFGPFVILAGAVVGLIAYLRRRASRLAPATLSDEQKAAAQALLGTPPAPPKDNA